MPWSQIKHSVSCYKYNASAICSGRTSPLQSSASSVIHRVHLPLPQKDARQHAAATKLYSTSSTSHSDSTSSFSSLDSVSLQQEDVLSITRLEHSQGKFYLTVQLESLASQDSEASSPIPLSSLSTPTSLPHSFQDSTYHDDSHVSDASLQPSQHLPQTSPEAVHLTTNVCLPHDSHYPSTETTDLSMNVHSTTPPSTHLATSDPSSQESTSASSSAITSVVATQQQSSPTSPQQTDGANPANMWALFMLFISYVHQSASGSAVPAMLPLISPDLHLSDFQGAFLTAGYSYLYALALIPVGLLADKTSRPILLSAGLMLWSSLCMKMGQVHDFNELILARVGFAAAQATQNPISFALIPDLFPKNKTTALAVYNCAIYLGRALSFAAVLLARSHPASPSVANQVNVQMLPLDQLDFQKTSLLYTQGNMAAVLPIYDYNYQVIEYGPVQEAAWRHLLWYIGVPGLLIAGLLAITVREPRSKSVVSNMGTPLQDSDSESESESESTVEVLSAEKAAPAAWSWMGLLSGLGIQQVGQTGMSVAMAGQAAATAPAELGLSPQGVVPGGQPNGLQLSSFKLPRFDVGPLGEVWKIPAFRAVTFAAAMNDVGSYALIAWHSTFYERVFHLDPSTYAPLLASVMPIGGIIGGVGGGFLADYLDKRGGRAWVTVGASVMAAPFMAESLLAPSYQMSFLALMCGFAMSEAWRSPSAIMIRSIAPASQASTATAVYICIRNLVGGMGPLAVAKLAELVGLQKAMLLAPACYLSSGLLFLVAEHMLSQDRKETAST